VKRAGKNITKEVAAAINQVSKKTRLDMGRQVRETIALKKQESEKPISVTATATAASLQATVRLKKTPRLGLRHFGAKQDKKGVTYKISRQGGRQRVNGAFLGPKPGVIKMSWKGNAFRRTGSGRLPIVQLKGVSAYGAYAKNELAIPLAADVMAELHKQIERRINQNILRAEGVLKH
jgi:hypothetical protein